MLPLILGGVATLTLGKLLYDSIEENNTLPIKPRVFISHSWYDGNWYAKFVNRFEENNVEFINHSVPVDKFIQGDLDEVKQKIDSKIKYSTCLLLVWTGEKPSKWIKFEIKCAIDYKKPIFVYRPKTISSLPPNNLLSKEDYILFNNFNKFYRELNNYLCDE